MSSQYHSTYDGQPYSSFAVGLVDEQSHSDSPRGQSSAHSLPLPARNVISYIASLPASQDVWLVQFHWSRQYSRLPPIVPGMSPRSELFGCARAPYTFHRVFN